MSNFICPHCQQIIDDGSDGFTSDREIELEKKLEIAVKALKFYAVGNHYEDDRAYDYYRILEYGETAEKALAKISEVKK